MLQIAEISICTEEQKLGTSFEEEKKRKNQRKKSTREKTGAKKIGVENLGRKICGKKLEENPGLKN